MRPIVLVLLAAVPVAAAAEEPANPPASEARLHYQKGTALFNLGEFADAAAEYKEAYKALNEPVFLYNIAQAYRLAGDYEKAAFFYTSYARNAKDPATRNEAIQRAKKLEEKLASVRKGKPEPEPAKPEAAKPDAPATNEPPKPGELPKGEPQNTAPVQKPASPEAAQAETPGPAWTGASERLSSMTDLIKTHRDQFRFCYDAWSKKHPKMGVKVSLVLTLQPNGTLQQAEAKAAGANAPELERCVTAMAKQLTFPPSSTGKMTRFSYPFEFKYRPEATK
jgi:tetratricopeptide (TPR) repeat protein